MHLRLAGNRGSVRATIPVLGFPAKMARDVADLRLPDGVTIRCFLRDKAFAGAWVRLTLDEGLAKPSMQVFIRG
jgi:hypothetical protein